MIMKQSRLSSGTKGERVDTTKTPRPKPLSTLSFGHSVRTSSYDGQSGVVYHEVEISGKPPSVSWITDYKTPNIVRTRQTPNKGKGVRSLAEMALLKLGIEAQDLTVGSLRTLPWTMGEQIWDQVVRNHAENFYIWRTFAIAFSVDFSSSRHRYMLELRTPSLPFADYLKGLDSQRRQWLTCLRVSPKQLSVPELVSISMLSNLAVLDLSDGQLYVENRESTFDMRVLRSWSELARSGRSFRYLEVLMLGWQEKADTCMFDLLDAFPRLSVVILTDCRKLNHKNHKDWEETVWKHGWEFLPSKRGVKHLRSLMDDKAFRASNISAMYYESRRLATAGVQSSKNSRACPLLECWLGNPRPWSHIIDEFPGTRTVYLQKLPNPRHPIVERVPLVSSTASSNHEPSSHNISTVADRVPKTRSVRRRDQKHSTVSLLAEIG